MGVLTPTLFLYIAPVRLVAKLGVAVAFGLVSCGRAVVEQSGAQPDWQAMRAEMVRTQLSSRDITNPRVLDAMRRVERHRFVLPESQLEAYGDYPIPIGHGQTISQPYIVAFMTQALELEPDHTVLEIGTGSGYQAAILAELVKEVYTIEIVPELAERARGALQEAGYTNAHVRTGNGYLGWPEEAPFDRIIVTAAPESVPPALVEQLRVGGLMAIPVGTAVQELRILRRTEGGVEQLQTIPVRFVPMVGKPK